MKILAIDTTTPFFTLAVYDDGKVCEYNLKTGHRLSKLLAPLTNRCLSSLRLTLADIDYFAAGCGPGSFTGIRLGLSFLKGLHLALNKPLIGESTLDIMAMNCPLTDKKVIPAIDAKRGLVYTSAYKYKNGKLSKIGPHLLISRKEFLRRIAPDSVVFGDALEICREDIIRKTCKVSFLDRDSWYPKAHNIITLALERIARGKRWKYSRLDPVYLYPNDCQVRK